MSSADILPLALAVALFSISHIVLSLPGPRSWLVAWLGETTFRALYSAVALALLFWVAL
ncbi:MAG: NnrU family protein, partial [Hyphomicrobium sp.]